jgi:alpha-amylase
MSWTADAATAGFTSGTPFRAVAPNVLTHNLESQRQDPQSIRAFYKTLIQLRRQRPSVARGSFEHAFADGLALGFQRRLGAERTLVLINYGSSEASVAVPGLGPRTTLRPLVPARAAALKPRAATLTLPSRSVQVYAIGR